MLYCVSAREVFGSMREGGKNPKNIWWNDAVKAPIERKEDTWVEVLGAWDEVVKKKDGRKFIKNSYKVYISQQKGGKGTVSKEDDSGCRWE